MWMRSLTALVVVMSIACSSSSEPSTSDAGTASAACALALGAPAAGCVETETAESAFSKVQSTCGIVDADLDVTDLKSPTLLASAKPKACASCDCRKAIYAYETVYQACTDAPEAANTAFAKNLYDLAAACK